MRSAFLIGLTLLLPGCSVVAPPTRMIAEWTRDWRQVATGDDRKRLRDWRTAFVAALALFLCRDEAGAITGANLSMDGGWTAQ